MKKMNFVALFTLLTVFAVSSALAANAVTVQAKKFSGFSKITKSKPSACEYSTVANRSERGDLIKVFLNSDLNSMINYAVEIPAADVPLKEGYSYKPFKNVSVTYSGGKLTVVEVRSDQLGPMGKVTETMQITVSPDLRVPSNAAAKSVYTSLFNKGTVDQQLSCEF